MVPSCCSRLSICKNPGFCCASKLDAGLSDHVFKFLLQAVLARHLRADQLAAVISLDHDPAPVRVGKIPADTPYRRYSHRDLPAQCLPDGLHIVRPSLFVFPDQRLLSSIALFRFGKLRFRDRPLCVIPGSIQKISFFRQSRGRQSVAQLL